MALYLIEVRHNKSTTTWHLSLKNIIVLTKDLHDFNKKYLMYLICLFYFFPNTSPLNAENNSYNLAIYNKI